LLLRSSGSGVQEREYQGMGGRLFLIACCRGSWPFLIDSRKSFIAKSKEQTLEEYHALASYIVLHSRDIVCGKSRLILLKMLKCCRDWEEGHDWNSFTCNLLTSASNIVGYPRLAFLLWPLLRLTTSAIAELAFTVATWRTFACVIL